MVASSASIVEASLLLVLPSVMVGQVAVPVAFVASGDSNSGPIVNACLVNEILNHHKYEYCCCNVMIAKMRMRASAKNEDLGRFIEIAAMLVKNKEIMGLVPMLLSPLWFSLPGQ